MTLISMTLLDMYMGQEQSQDQNQKKIAAQLSSFNDMKPDFYKSPERA